MSSAWDPSASSIIDNTTYYQDVCSNNSLPTDVFTYTTVQTITSIKINIVNVTLFTGADLLIQFFDASNNIVTVKELGLYGDDYLNWPSGDDYIIEFVKSKMEGLVIPHTHTTI